MLQTFFSAGAFAVVAGAYAVAAALSLGANVATLPARLYGVVLVMAAAWCAIYATWLWQAPVWPDPWPTVADAVRSASLVALLAALLKEAVPEGISRRVTITLIFGGAALALVTLFGASWYTIVQAPAASSLGHVCVVVQSLLGALILEQIVRNSTNPRQRGLWQLVLALGIVLATDLLVHSYMILSDALTTELAFVRCAAAAIALPFLVKAGQSRPEWGRRLYVSRQMAFYTTGLLGAGVYLFVMAALAAFMQNRLIGLTAPLQLLVLVVTLSVLMAVLFSTNLRRRIKVFISKHFYRDRYDYRREWLRLIETLVGRTDDMPLRIRAVRALAEIVDSDRGELWIRDDTGGYFEPHGSWGMVAPSRPIALSSELARYLEKSHWVVDTLEYRATPDLYANAFSADEEFLSEDSIFVPLLNKDRLIGIVRIDRPATLGRMSYEDHDLLKTAGQQVAVFLVQEQAQEALFETRQFEAFTKLTAFLMHDLKNVIAQQDLVVSNARRFKHRPEFVDDAISTISASVERMRKILDRLQGATRMEKTSRVDLIDLLHEVSAECSDRRPRPNIVLPGEHVEVEIDRDRLAMAITHVVRNAQDATPEQGLVQLRLTVDDKTACIEVEDSGCGMDAEFVRTRLFRPFDSTKGAQGMGIGAYQIRESVQAAGGRVEVISVPGNGTTMRISLPVAAAIVSEAQVV